MPRPPEPIELNPDQTERNAKVHVVLTKLAELRVAADNLRLATNDVEDDDLAESDVMDLLEHVAMNTIVDCDEVTEGLQKWVLTGEAY